MGFRSYIIALAASLLLSGASTPLFAQSDVYQQQEQQQQQQGKVARLDRDRTEEDEQEESEKAAYAEQLRRASSQNVRRFHEVLDELLAEFGYDVKMGQIKGLKNIAIRKIRVSKAIPRSYERYMDMLLTERIRENSRIRLINCIPCRTRTSSVVDGKLLVTSPATNMAKLDSAAASLGVDNFMDAVLVYHTTHMVLAVTVFDVTSKETVWARTYNSETIKSRYQKLAIDYSQVEKSRPGEDYQPEYRFLFGLGGAGMPNVGGTTEDSSMLNFQIRATEKFNGRKNEFGMMLSVLKTTASMQTEYPTEGETAEADTTTETETVASGLTPEPFETALGLYGMYGHLFVGPLESYNNTRHGVHFGAGLLLASSYIAPLVRTGWDIYFGRRWSTNIGVTYVGASSILVDGESIDTEGGAGGDLVISLNY
jgi:hypothetical protein